MTKVKKITPRCKNLIKHFSHISVANLALNRPCWQHSTMYRAVASRAVDGNANPKVGAGSCTHSNKHTYPTWGVDLQAMSKVNYVEIQRREGPAHHGMWMNPSTVPSTVVIKWWKMTKATRSSRAIRSHYCDVIMGEIASQITSLTIVYSTVYSDADQKNHQSSASLAFERGIHRGPVNSPHRWPVTRKMFPFDDVIMGVFR